MSLQTFSMLAGALFAVLLAAGATTTTAKKTVAPAKKTVASARKYQGKAVVRRKSTAAGKAPARTMAYHPMAPSADRYKEIQQTLISKGYLQGEPTGVWDQNSISAMKKFQEDQKLDPTGKITARALIDLGLGPKDASGSTTITPTANK